MEYITKWFIYFIIYAFLGYLCEVIYVFICTKKLTNRGYLYGPLVPIYGAGAILIIIPLSPLYNYFPLVFLLGVLITTTLEYLVSLGMELIFHMRWWDYSEKFLNINGRVCLRNSTMFGILVMVVIYGIHPATKFVTNYLFEIKAIGYTVSAIILIGFIIDFIFSTIRHVGIAKIIKNFNIMREEIKTKAAVKKEELVKNFKELALKEKILSKIERISKKHPTLMFKSKKYKVKVKIDDVKKEIEDTINE
ncbi:MAG: putative ABC transporter permease [Acholeplasmatales bacterium]|nr:putative ABC transporter permease [Acholeplasmatales bacterium]